MNNRKRSPHIGYYGGSLRDYNGVGRWSVAAVQERYRQYCRRLQIENPSVPVAREYVQEEVRWVYPIMESVTEGIERGDGAEIELGIEFVEEDDFFVFGKG